MGGSKDDEKEDEKEEKEKDEEKEEENQEKEKEEKEAEEDVNMIPGIGMMPQPVDIKESEEEKSPELVEAKPIMDVEGTEEKLEKKAEGGLHKKTKKSRKYKKMRKGGAKSRRHKRGSKNTRK